MKCALIFIFCAAVHHHAYHHARHIRTVHQRVYVERSVAVRPKSRSSDPFPGVGVLNK